MGLFFVSGDWIHFFFLVEGGGGGGFKVKEKSKDIFFVECF